MSKREVFIVADGSPKVTNQAELLARLDREEAFLLKNHPLIDDEMWRSCIPLRQNAAREQIAIFTIEALRELKTALRAPTTPMWKAAHLGIKYQNLVMIYRQPGTAAATGKAHRGIKPTRKAEDQLAITVLRQLRRGGMTWNQAKRQLAAAAEDLEEIAGVEIDEQNNSQGFIFRKRSVDGPAVEQHFKLSTLRNKWSKAK